MGKQTVSKIAFILVFLSARSLRGSLDPPPRILNVRVAIDRDLVSIDSWSTEISRVLKDAFFLFRTRFGIQIKIKEIKTWHPDPDSDSPFGLLSSLEREIGHEGCDAVLGIASPEHDFGGRPGVSCCSLNYILVQYLNLKRDLKTVIQHELCHLFGAPDLRQKNSIMSGDSSRYVFDDFTSRIILLNRNRDFYPGSPLFAVEKRDEAISLYRERADLNLGEENLHAMLAILYYDKADYAASEGQCTKALSLNPGSLAAGELIGHVHLAQGAIDEAIADFRKVLAVQRKSPIPHFNLGVALYEKGQTDEAISEFREAIKAKPDYLDAYANLASAYIRQGEVDNSINACRAALGLTADVPEVHYLLALGLVLKWEAFSSSANNAATGILEKAVSSCQKVISLKPDMAVAHNLMGITYHYAGRLDLAEAEFQKALDLNPQLASAHLNLGLMYFQRNEHEKSADHIRQILETDASSGIGLEILDLVFKNMKRYDMLSAKKR